MEINIREMKQSDWGKVSSIYQEGIKTKTATFEQEAPDFEEWNQSHLPTCRLVAAYGPREGEDQVDLTVVGWAALTPVSNRCVYQGVAEVSVYVGETARAQGIGKALLLQLIDASEAAGIWTLQSSIISSNQASIDLHEKCGFRLIGIRERIARDIDGTWQDIVIMERRSSAVE